jgi:carboxyl-terminal processing protease
MKTQRFFLLSGAALLILLGFLGRGFLPGTSQSGPPAKDFALMRTVANLIRNDYVEERDPERTMDGAYRGLVNGLDPLSAYLDKEALAVFDADRRSRLKETGIVLFKRYNVFPQVMGVVEGSPAEKAGLKPGDTLSAFDDRSTLTMSFAEARLALKGADGKPVKVRVIQQMETKDFEVERKALFDAPVRWSEEPGGPAVLAVRTVDGTAAQLRGPLAKKLKAAGGPLVLDLRLASEGSLAEALKLANVFLKAADAGAIDRKEGVKESLSCPEAPLVETAPLVVWVGPATIGAAEATAGLLQEAGRARVVGFETQGLASRQSVFRLEDGSGLLLTTGIYALPSGRKLWDQGVVPDAALDPGDRTTAAYLKTTKGLPTEP